MFKNKRINVIIPAHNEGQSIAKVIRDLPDCVDEVIVTDNNSTDDTAKQAKTAGATVCFESQMGYGYACLKAMAYIESKSEKPDIIVFIDGDYSDYPEQLTELIHPIIDSNYDFVIGARVKSLRENGAMTFPQRFGNWLATTLMQLIYGAKFTDLGPFRAIKYNQLLALNMQDKTYGWTVEMQLKALNHKLKYKEIPVKYRNRIGQSKVSGTLKGAVMAGIKILTWVFKYAFVKT
ncbi:glycosyltransferase family 2 protein [Flavobacteriaceae bacterium 14752]|uniref:glycosyltransferase family 2 protein n=1 Tax=Mesohalobacter salilacus TaxID=2491711 RepID=UPI000F636261|nr:glycosyltransferase family 2 protein [Flavobacteriaceae bacterium 14752]